MKKLLVLLSLVLAIFLLTACDMENLPFLGNSDSDTDPDGDNTDGDDVPNGDPNCAHNLVFDSDKKATCTEDGYTSKEYCVECGYVKTPSKAIPATGHNIVKIPAVASTCKEAGHTAGSMCSVCDTIFVPVVPTEQPKHQVVNTPYVAPTCTTQGHEGGKHCNICGTTIEEPTKIYEAFGHEIGLDHITVIPAVEPTCKRGEENNDGKGWTEKVYCEICDEYIVLGHEIAAIDHDENDLEIIPGYAATCANTGLSDGQKCNACGVITIEQEVLEIDPANHPEDQLTVIGGEEAVAPTCHSDGMTAGLFCNACNTRATTPEVNTNRPEHTLDTVQKVDPVCATETDGHEEYQRCTVDGCGYTTEIVVIKYEHTPGDWVTDIEPGVGTEGERHTHCTEDNCGKLLVEQIPALPEGDQPTLPDDYDPDGIV